MRFVPELSLDNNMWLPEKETATYEIYCRNSVRRLRALRRLDAGTIDILRREGVTELQVFSSDMRDGLDLCALKLAPELEAISLHLEYPVDLTPLLQLKRLQELTLLTRGFKAQPLDFLNFRRLHAARLTWSPGLASVLSCGSLRGLTIENSRNVKEFDLRKLNQLRELSLTECLGLERVICSPANALESLGIASCRSFQFIEPAVVIKTLKWVALGGGSNFEIESLSVCGRLKRLSMLGVGKIRSLKFLSNCPELERLAMHLSTQIEDGDLNVLLDLPKLNAVSFRRFKNYTHTLAEIRRI